ncbi:MAG: putative PEP-binding protein [Pirellulaceae bacterium]
MARSRSAPTPTRQRTASEPREFGAQGIGLCRTEHMFFGGERITGHSPDDRSQ